MQAADSWCRAAARGGEGRDCKLISRERTFLAATAFFTPLGGMVLGRHLGAAGAGKRGSASGVGLVNHARLQGALPVAPARMPSLWSQMGAGKRAGRHPATVERSAA